MESMAQATQQYPYMVKVAQRWDCTWQEQHQYTGFQTEAEAHAFKDIERRRLQRDKWRTDSHYPIEGNVIWMRKASEKTDTSIVVHSRSFANRMGGMELRAYEKGEHAIAFTNGKRTVS